VFSFEGGERKDRIFLGAEVRGKDRGFVFEEREEEGKEEGERGRGKGGRQISRQGATTQYWFEWDGIACKGKQNASRSASVSLRPSTEQTYTQTTGLEVSGGSLERKLQALRESRNLSSRLSLSLSLQLAPSLSLQSGRLEWGLEIEFP
jgi:hypothetical protein